MRGRTGRDRLTRRKRSVLVAYASSQGVEDERSANAEADDGSKRHEIEHLRGQAEIIREQGDHGADHSEHVEPQRRVNVGQITAKAQLQQQGGEADRGHYH